MRNIKQAWNGALWIALARLKRKIDYKLILCLCLEHTLSLIIIFLTCFHCRKYKYSDCRLWCSEMKSVKQGDKIIIFKLGSSLHLLSAVFDTDNIILRVQLERTSTEMFLAGDSHNSNITPAACWHFLTMCSRILYRYFLSFHSEHTHTHTK